MMETLQRLQPMDILFAVLWAAIVGWGLQAGLVRQLGMLVGVYGAAILSGSLYRQGGAALAMAYGPENLPQFEFGAYAAIFAVVFVVVGLILWRAYPASRISRGFGTDNLLGGIVGAAWGVLLLIGVLTIMRFYSAVPWRGQESTQLSIMHQVQRSQVAPVLEVVAAPLWQLMAPWFPAPVNAHL